MSPSNKSAVAGLFDLPATFLFDEGRIFIRSSDRRCLRGQPILASGASSVVQKKRCRKLPSLPMKRQAGAG